MSCRTCSHSSELAEKPTFNIFSISCRACNVEVSSVTPGLKAAQMPAGGALGTITGTFGTVPAEATPQGMSSGTAEKYTNYYG